MAFREHPRDSDHDRERDRKRYRDRSWTRDQDMSRGRGQQPASRWETPDYNNHNGPRRVEPVLSRHSTFPQDAPKPSPSRQNALVERPPSIRSDSISDNGKGQQSPRPPTGPRDPDLKRLIDLVCDRNFWYMQRDSTDKKQKKLQADLDRCAPMRSDFASITDVFASQKKILDEEKAKIWGRLTSTDEKLHTAAVAYVDKIRSSIIIDDVAKPTDNASTLAAVKDLEARLAAAQKSTEESVTKKLAEETEHIKKTLQKQHDDATSDLQSRLEVESQKNALLSEKFEQLARRFDAIENRALQPVATASVDGEASQPHSTQLLDKTQLASVETRLDVLSETTMASVKNHSQQILRLGSRLDSMSQGMVSQVQMKEALAEGTRAMSQLVNNSSVSAVEGGNTNDVDHKLRLLESTIKSHSADLHQCIDRYSRGFAAMDDVQSTINGLQQSVADLDSSAKTGTIKLKESETAIAALESRISHMPMSPRETSHTSSVENRVKTPPLALEAGDGTAPVGISKQEMVDMIALQVNGVKEHIDSRFQTAALGFGNMINKERERATSIEHTVSEIRSQLTATNQAVTALEVSSSELGSNIRAQKEYNEKAIDWQKKAYATARSRTDFVQAEAAAAQESLVVQLQSLNAWQSNFSTRHLYTQIVEHINATMPGGVVTQLKTLGSRLGAVESRLYDDEAQSYIKRRKLQNGGAMETNGVNGLR